MNRPPIGFIVEGHGEYNSYPSLFCKINNISGVKIPVVNAGGCGSIIRNIDEQLTSLMMTDSPENVIVTVDLKDAIYQGFAKDKNELVALISDNISAWKEKAGVDGRLEPLPDNIVFVVQVRKFESWIISDVEGLKKAEIVRSDVSQPLNAEDIIEPTKWLKDSLKIDVNIKSPIFAKKVVAALNPSVMVQHSQSFMQFYNECKLMAERWMRKFEV